MKTIVLALLATFGGFAAGVKFNSLGTETADGGKAEVTTSIVSGPAAETAALESQISALKAQVLAYEQNSAPGHPLDSTDEMHAPSGVKSKLLPTDNTSSEWASPSSTIPSSAEAQFDDRLRYARQQVILGEKSKLVAQDRVYLYQLEELVSSISQAKAATMKDVQEIELLRDKLPEIIYKDTAGPIFEKLALGRDTGN